MDHRNRNGFLNRVPMQRFPSTKSCNLILSQTTLALAFIKPDYYTTFEILYHIQCAHVLYIVNFIETETKYDFIASYPPRVL